AADEAKLREELLKLHRRTRRTEQRLRSASQIVALDCHLGLAALLRVSPNRCEPGQAQDQIRFHWGAIAAWTAAVPSWISPVPKSRRTRSVSGCPSETCLSGNRKRCLRSGRTGSGVMSYDSMTAPPGSR